MRIAICDDESAIRNEIVRFVKKQQPDADIMTFASGEEILAEQKDFAIYFLDIDMGALSGIDVAKAIRAKQEQQPRSIIIFITGYREYMEDAFDVNAYHYLVKPINEAKFSEVFGRAWKEAKALEDNRKRRILVKTAGMSKSVFLKDIFYIESSNKKVVFHTAQDNFEIYAKMESLETELRGSFYRCHRCYLVNMEKISDYNADTIQLVNGEKLILAQKKYPDFVRAFMRYAKGGGIINV